MRWVAVIYAPNRWGPIKVIGPFRSLGDAEAWRRQARPGGYVEIAPMWPGEARWDWPPVAVEPSEEGVE